MRHQLIIRRTASGDLVIRNSRNALSRQKCMREASHAALQSRKIRNYI